MVPTLRGTSFISGQIRIHHFDDTLPFLCIINEKRGYLGENKTVVPFSICTDCTNDFGVFIRHRIKMNKYLIRFTFCYSYSDLEK